MRPIGMKPVRYADLEHRIIMRWHELIDQRPEAWDDGADGTNMPLRPWKFKALELAEQEVIAEYDSVYLGAVNLVVRCDCPHCGETLTIELTGGQVTAK